MAIMDDNRPRFGDPVTEEWEWHWQWWRLLGASGGWVQRRRVVAAVGPDGLVTQVRWHYR